MTTNIWGDVILQSFQNLWTGIIEFIPQIVVALIILIFGWVIGALLGRVVTQLLRSIRIDEALSKTGLSGVLQKGGMELNSAGFVGGLVEWFIIIVFLVASFDVLGLKQVNIFLQEVVLIYLPKVIVAVLILLVAAVIADIIKRVVSASAKTAGIHAANLTGTIAKWSVWVFAIFAAMVQLEIAGSLINTLFTGFVVAFSLALGLAFGLGGQEAAARFIDEIKREVSDNKG
ncbi:MAG: hypothetical protein U1D31_01655 [Patescibacteria group bacterium]|nr:hypothetical protein [bacterium]MDZ4240813.1 hypothetical protein [Patescibacteria group bacterium]